MIANFASCYMSHRAISATKHGGNLQRLISETLQDSWYDLIATDQYIPMTDDEVVATWKQKLQQTGLFQISRAEARCQEEVKSIREELFAPDVINDPESWDFALQA